MIVKNNHRKLKKYIRFIIVLLWIGLISFTVYYIWDKKIAKNGTITTVTVNGVTSTVSEEPVTKKQVEEYKVPPSHPRYISIPELNINKARVTQIGIIKNTNQLDAPLSIYDAGWFTKSALPGSGRGAVLLDGHNGGPNYGGIFEKLGKLSTDSKIIIERGDGKIFTYKVVDNRQMLVSDINDPNNKYGMSTILNSIDPAKEGLNIITCVGQWIQDSRTFNSRVMLRAVRID